MRKFFSVLVGALLLAAPVRAEDYTIHSQWLIEAQPGTFYANGVGAPTVAYDPVDQVYVMFFETRLADADATCPVGRWGIGAAVSVDGLNWNVEPDPVITPEANTSHSCVVAHPVVVRDGSTWRLWFKAEQGKDQCGDWGCNRQTGVGYATGSVILSDSSSEQLSDLNAQKVLVEDEIDRVLDEFEAEPWLDAAEIYQDDESPAPALSAAIDTAEATGWQLADYASGKSKDPYAAWVGSGDFVDDLNALLVELAPLDDPASEAFEAETLAMIDQTVIFEDELGALLAQQGVIDQEIADVQAGITDATRFSFFARTNPVLNVSGFGYPAVTKVGNQWEMLVAKVPNLYRATSSDPGKNWSMSATPVMEPGVTSWTEDEIFNPSLVCEDSGTFPYTLFFGGRNISNFFQIDLGGWGKAISEDNQTWWIAAAAYFQWTGQDKWRHWDAMRVGSDYLIWYSEKDASGRNRVGLAHSTPSASWDANLISPRICPP